MKRTKKTHYLRLLSVLLVSTTLLWSCGKSDDFNPKSEFYIKLKVNGKAEVFDGVVFATRGRSADDDQVHRLILSGHADESDILEGVIAIDLYSESAITGPRSLRASDLASPSGAMGQANIVWNRDGTSQYHVTGPQNMIDLMERGSGIKSHLTVNITTIDNTSIRGTFSGTAIGTPYPEGDRFFPGIITEGEFYVPLIGGL